MSEALAVYRALLRGLRTYPSTRRGALVESVKAEFRAHARETDPAAIQRHMAAARNGLTHLGKYSPARTDGPNVAIDLESG